MDIENEIFKRKKPEEEKLILYGFIKNEGKYIYKTKITDNFEMIVTVNQKVKGKIIDLDFNEEYINFRNENQTGEFVGEIRNKFISVLSDISIKCFKNKYFITIQANRIADLIYKKYKDKPIFKWKNNDAAVFENNKKWYGIIMKIDRKKLDSKSGEIEILNIKLDKNKIEILLKQKGFYRAYHMNKKYWITIPLDGTLSDKEIMNLIEHSYSYTLSTSKSENEWIMPVNPEYFDIFTYLDSSNTFYFDKKRNFKIGDIIYLYITKPIGSVMYKLIVKDYKDEFMIVSKEKKYKQETLSLNILKKYGLTSVRSTRHIPIKLSKYIKECVK